MVNSSSLAIALVADQGERTDMLAEGFSLMERQQVCNLPTGRRRRHFVLGRYAAVRAIRQVLGDRASSANIAFSSLPGLAPRVIVDGLANRIHVSISHSSRLAAACAWPSSADHLVSAGIDVERVRPNEVAESYYAFSQRERRLLARTPEGPWIAGLAAWTAKEAVWKALLAEQEIGPDAIDIQKQCLDQGTIVVRTRGALKKRLGNNRLRVRTHRICRPDGEYVLSLARVLDGERES